MGFIKKELMTQIESLRFFIPEPDEDLDEAYLGKSTVEKMRSAKLFTDEPETNLDAPKEEAEKTPADHTASDLATENALLEAALQKEQDAFVMEEQFPAAVFKREMDPTIKEPTVQDWARVARQLQTTFEETFAGRTRQILDKETHRYSRKTRRPEGVQKRRDAQKMNRGEETQNADEFRWGSWTSRDHRFDKFDKKNKTRSKKSFHPENRKPQYMTPHEMKELKKAKNLRKNIDKSMDNVFMGRPYTPAYQYRQAPIDNRRYERNSFSE